MTPDAGAGGRVVMAANEVERMILVRIDLDRYENRVIPDLHQRVRDLTLALSGLVAAASDASRANMQEALDRSRRVLADDE